MSFRFLIPIGSQRRGHHAARKNETAAAAQVAFSQSFDNFQKLRVRFRNPIRPAASGIVSVPIRAPETHQHPENQPCFADIRVPAIHPLVDRHS